MPEYVLSKVLGGAFFRTEGVEDFLDDDNDDDVTVISTMFPDPDRVDYVDDDFFTTLLLTRMTMRILMATTMSRTTMMTSRMSNIHGRHYRIL